MKSTLLWTLVGLNAVLLFLFIGGVGRSNSAMAQARRPGNYILIPGQITGGATEVVYVLDTSNGRIGAIGYDDVNRRLEGLPSVNLDAVFNANGPDDLSNSK
jgi:hypothetical protein